MLDSGRGVRRRDKAGKQRAVWRSKWFTEEGEDECVAASVSLQEDTHTHVEKHILAVAHKVHFTSACRSSASAEIAALIGGWCWKILVLLENSNVWKKNTLRHKTRFLNKPVSAHLSLWIQSNSFVAMVFVPQAASESAVLGGVPSWLPSFCKNSGTV